MNNETNCIYGTYDCDDGCGGTRQCCSTAPACDNSYKYTCSGIGYSGGKGTACEGQYTECNCSSGYTWNSGSCDYCGDSYKYSCSGTGYSSGSGTACGGKYTSCNCSSGYTWDGSACVEDETNCTVGMIYYSDGSCSSTYNSSKNIIGVIGHIDTGTNTALIIQINSSLSYYWDSSSTPIDTSLENYQGTTSAVDDKNGYSNTTIMISELGSNATAAKYCADLSVKVTLTGICHLPVNWNILYMIIILQ